MDKREVERLERLSEEALKLIDVKGISQSNAEAWEGWAEVEDKIDDLEMNISVRRYIV